MRNSILSCALLALMAISCQKDIRTLPAYSKEPLYSDNLLYTYAKTFNGLEYVNVDDPSDVIQLETKLEEYVDAEPCDDFSEYRKNGCPYHFSSTLYMNGDSLEYMLTGTYPEHTFFHHPFYLNINWVDWYNAASEENHVLISSPYFSAWIDYDSFTVNETFSSYLSGYNLEWEYETVGKNQLIHVTNKYAVTDSNYRTPFKSFTLDKNKGLTEFTYSVVNGLAKEREHREYSVKTYRLKGF